MRKEKGERRMEKGEGRGNSLHFFFKHMQLLSARALGEDASGTGGMLCIVVKLWFL